MAYWLFYKCNSCLSLARLVPSHCLLKALKRKSDKHIIMHVSVIRCNNANSQSIQPNALFLRILHSGLKKKQQTFASLSASKWKNIVKCLSLVKKKKKGSCFTNKIFRNSTVHFSVTLCYLNFKLMKVYRCAVGWYPIINLFFLLFFPVV